MRPQHPGQYKPLSLCSLQGGGIDKDQEKTQGISEGRRKGEETMTAALRHRNDEKRIASFSEPTKEINFLPPESFLVYYSLLVEAVYLTRQPEPEVKQWIKRSGFRIPVRNYRAYRKLRQIDQRLYEAKYEIVQYLGEPQ